jgi:hypothetical protein
MSDAGNRAPLQSYVVTILNDSIPPTDPLWIRLVRHDGSVQAEIMVASGYRLVADADGVRAENFVERWLTDHQAGPPCP